MATVNNTVLIITIVVVLVIDNDDDNCDKDGDDSTIYVCTTHKMSLVNRKAFALNLYHMDFGGG